MSFSQVKMSLEEKDKEISRLRQELKEQSSNQLENNQLDSAQVQELRTDILNLIDDESNRTRSSDFIEMEVSKAIQQVSSTLSNEATDVTESNDDVIGETPETDSHASNSENEETETSSNNETELMNEEMSADNYESIPNKMITAASQSRKDEEAASTSGQTLTATAVLQPKQTQKNIIESILLDSDSEDDEDIEILGKVLLADIQLKKEMIDSDDMTRKESYQISEVFEDEYMESYIDQSPALDVNSALPNDEAELTEAEQEATNARTHLETGDFRRRFTNALDEFVLNNDDVDNQQSVQVQSGSDTDFHAPEHANEDPVSAEIWQRIEANILLAGNDADGMEVNRPCEIPESNENDEDDMEVNRPYNIPESNENDEDGMEIIRPYDISESNKNDEDDMEINRPYEIPESNENGEDDMEVNRPFEIPELNENDEDDMEVNRPCVIPESNENDYDDIEVNRPYF